MSPLTRMAAERAEHEQVQVRVRARMPLLPPVLRGFGGAPPPRRFGVARVDGSDAYRAEAEPFTVKRSGTGWWVFPMLFIVIK